MTILPVKLGRRPLRRHRFVEVWFYGHVPVLVRHLLINPGHTPPSSCPVPYPRNVVTRHLVQHVERVIASGESADGYGPVEPDLTPFDCFLDIGELFEVFGGRDEVSGGFG